MFLKVVSDAVKVVVGYVIITYYKFSMECGSDKNLEKSVNIWQRHGQMLRGMLLTHSVHNISTYTQANKMYRT